MEKELFSWINIHHVDVGHFGFTNIVTNVEIDNIPAGSKFRYAELNYRTGVLKFYSEDGEKVLHIFKLQLVVVSEL